MNKYDVIRITEFDLDHIQTSDNLEEARRKRDQEIDYCRRHRIQASVEIWQRIE